MFGRLASIEWLTPSLAELVLEGDGLDGFTPLDSTDAYVNVALPPAGAPYTAPFELDDLKDLPREQRPFRRRWTVRSWDEDSRRLTIQVVVHGDAGPGSAWANNAKPGDALVFTGPAAGYRPDPDADWHLMVGDESVLPAIAASLEAVPPATPVVVRLVCDGPDHEVALDTPGELDLRWLHREGGPGDEDLLADSVAALDPPGGEPHAFVHGEAGEIRSVRRHLIGRFGMAPERLSCSPYWRRGLDDEGWREIKAAWNAEVAAEVPA